MTLEGTNTWIIGANEKLIIDPGPACEAHLDRILEAVHGHPVQAIAVTHGHADHAGNALALKERLNAPIAALSPAFRAPAIGPAASLPIGPNFQSIDPDWALHHGDSFTVDGQIIGAHHMPGHTHDHLCFSIGEMLVTGDLVLPKTPSVVAPPEGSITAILQSLEMIKSGPWQIGLPGHGETIPDLSARAGALITHRLNRLNGLRRALTSDWQSISALRATEYGDVSERYHTAVDASILAQLIALETYGEVELTNTPHQPIARLRNATIRSF